MSQPSIIPVSSPSASIATAPTTSKCHQCWGILQSASSPHANSKTCPLRGVKCFDCGGAYPCTSKECLMPTYCVCAIFDILQGPTPKSEDDSTKLLVAARSKYGLENALHIIAETPIADRRIFLPGYLGNATPASQFFVLKGVPKPCISLDVASIQDRLVGGFSLAAFSPLVKAVRELFPPTQKDALKEKDASSQDQQPESSTVPPQLGGVNSSSLDIIVASISSLQKSVEELKAKNPAMPTIPSVKDIKNKEKSFVDFLKTIDPVSGGLAPDLPPEQLRALQDVPAHSSVLSGELNALFSVKLYAHGGDEKLKEMVVVDGKVVQSKKVLCHL